MSHKQHSGGGRAPLHQPASSSLGPKIQNSISAPLGVWRGAQQHALISPPHPPICSCGVGTGICSALPSHPPPSAAAGQEQACAPDPPHPPLFSIGVGTDTCAATPASPPPLTCSCGVGTIIRTEEALERLRLMRTSCRAGRGGGRGKSGPHAQVWEGRGTLYPGVEGADL